MSYFTPAQEPESPLARYRLLAPTASVRVSPLCLGAMNFGSAWYVTLPSLRLGRSNLRLGSGHTWERAPKTMHLLCWIISTKMEATSSIRESL